MSPSYALIAKLLRWLTRIYKLQLEVGFIRSSATLIQLVYSLCKRVWSHLTNPSTSSHHGHRHANPTPPSNAHERVYLSHLPTSIQVQDAAPHSSPTTDSFQVSSSLALASSGYTGPAERVSDSSSEAIYNDPRCTTTTTQTPHLGLGNRVNTLATNAHGDIPSVITLDHEPRSTGDASGREGHLGGGTQTLRVTFNERPLSPAVSYMSANDGAEPRSRQRPRERPVVPMTADEMMFRRYGRKGQADWKTSNRSKIQPGCRDYSDDCPAGWVRHVQAEGAQYFYHTEKKVLTDADMYNKKLMPAALAAAESLYTSARQRGIDVTGDTELVLELEVKRKKDHLWMYYFVDHAAQVVFWIHPMEQKKLVGHVGGVQRKSHLKYAIESHYWYVGAKLHWRLSFVSRMHREMFPLNRPIPLSILKSLKATVIHAQAESITASDTSLAPFDVDELANLVDLVDRTEEGAMEGQSDIVFVIARLIRMFTESKFVNFYGEIGARLNADQSVYSNEDHKPSKILPVLDIFLFGAASGHLQTLKGLWVDHTVNFPRWKGFINRLLAEWNSFTIYSTVMLAVDVSLLGKPGLQNTSTADPQRRAALISIYLSLACIVGSLLVSVLLVGQARGQERQSAKGAADFMKRMTHSMLGLEALAIMQSVPYALLVWGMLFFVLAISFIIFGSQDLVIIAIVSPAWVVVVLLCLWPLWGSRQRRASLYMVWKRTVGRLPPVHLSLPLPTFKKTSTPPLPTIMTPSAEAQ